MTPWFETVSSLVGEDEDVIRRRRYGVIEVRRGEFVGIHMRPWPKIVSVAEAWWDGGVRSRKNRDRCLLYYNHPVSSSDYLALKYIVSSQATGLKTIRESLRVLDEVARIKRSDAIVCEASNLRISDRLLARWGWERHVLTSRRRHHIRRFYGSYPTDKLSVCDGTSDLGTSDLGTSDLGTANLETANLETANLETANLEIANLQVATCD